MKSSERRYEARIEETYRNGQPGAGGQTGRISEFTYTYYTVDSDNILREERVAPFRHIFVPTGGAEEPLVIAASPGDDCAVKVCRGQMRLVEVPEQFLTAPCDDPGTTPV